MNVEALQKEVAELKEKIKDLEAHLKKYTNPERCHKYYQNHKEEIDVKTKVYYQSVPPKWVDNLFTFTTPEVNCFSNCLLI